MRRWLIAAGIVVVVLGSALAIALANLGRFLGTHRERLAARVEREIGRPVEFGDLGVSLRGGPGVRIAGVRVVEDPDWGGGDLLRAEEVRVTVRLLPALLGRFEIRRIVVRAPVLTVVRDQRGWNLGTLGRRAGRKARRDESGARERRDDAPFLVALADVRDGEVRFIDRRGAPPLEVDVRQLDLSASDIAPGRPVAVEANAAVLGAAESNLELHGTVGPFDDRPALEQTPIDLRGTLDGADAGALLHAATAFDVAAPRDLIAAGPLAGRAHVQGTLDRLAVEGRLDASSAAIRLGTAFAKAPGLGLTAELTGDRADGGLTVRRGTIRLGDAALDVTGVIRPGDPATVALRLDSNRAPLAPLASATPAASGMAVDGWLETHLTVQGALRSEPPPDVAGTVALADVHARRPGDRAGLSGLSTTITVAGGVARMPPTRFCIGDATVDAGGAYTLAGRQLTAKGTAIEVFGGTLAGKARVDLAQPRPHFRVGGAARGVSLAPLLAARRSRLAAHVAGRLDADVSLAGAGVRRRAVRRSLRGTARIDVRDGVLAGVNLVDEVLGAATGVERAGRLVPARLRRKRPALFGAADTRFQELRATARIRNGRAVTDDLVLRTDAYTVTGRGHSDLDGNVDLTARFVAGPALTADVLASVKDARWVTNDRQLVEVPFRVTGRFPALRPEPDATFVARAVGRALAERARKALRDDDAQDGGGVVEDALRGLERLFDR